MGRTHSNAFLQAPRFFRSRLSTSAQENLCKKCRPRAGLRVELGHEGFETDWRKLAESPEIDLVDIATPNDTHAEIAIAAAQAGKMARARGRRPHHAESEAMVKAVEKAAVANMVGTTIAACPPSCWPSS